MQDSPFMKLVSGRRSVRKYKAAPVEREKLEFCLEAARLAPSACNSQPYKFLVLDDKELKDKFCAAAFGGIYSPCKFAAVAPALVLVLARQGKLMAFMGNQVQHTNFRLVDIGIAAEHFVLAAAEQGLGTCWVGWFDAKAGARALGLSGEKIEMVIPVGYPDEAPAARPRKPADEIRSYDKI